MKGRIERFLKTLNYGLVHLQPGTTFATYDKRYAYDSNRSAVLTLEALKEIVHRWVIDVYSISFHRGIQTTPKQKWEEGIAKFPLRLPPSTDAVHVYLGNSVTRRLSKNGVELHSLQYASPELQDLRRRRGDTEVQVRSDPDNIGSIFVFDEEQRRYIEAKSTLPSYAEGLTVEQHRWILSKARRDYKGSPLHRALLAAKSALREYTEQVIRDHGLAGKKSKHSKVGKVTKEVMVQQEEARQHSLPLEPLVDEEQSIEAPDDDWPETGDVPLFPIRRGPIAPGVPHSET